MITFKVDNLIHMDAALREFTDYLQRSDVCEDIVFDCRLVSCELITNVIRHCGEAAFFSGSLSGEGIEIRVSSENGGDVVVAPVLPDVFAESGRGLYIVNAICNGEIEVDGNCIRAFIRRR